MRNLIQLAKSAAVRPTRRTASALTITAALAVAGVTAAQGNAAPSHKGKKASHRLRYDDVFKQPKLRLGLLAVVGSQGNDKIALRLEAGNPDVIEVDVGDDGSADFSFKRRKISAIVVDARAGDDLVRIDESNGIFTADIPAVLAGGDGNDTIAGGSGAETLLGGDGNDTIDGNAGNDRALLGAGDDSFVWDPGDGSDTIEGQDGSDTMVFNGANVAEHVDLSANGNRLKFFRDRGNITMDTDGVERVDFNALGGADVVTVNDLSGTDVNSVNVDLSAADDTQADRVIVNGTNGNDIVNVNGDASGVTVSGLHAAVAIQHQQPTDELVVNGLGGNDAISATGLAAQAITPTLDGGTGDDRIAGGPGKETLLGADGNDTIDGNGGNDLAVMGAGDDTFIWDPGDGSDTIEGQDGSDRMVFNGAGGPEHVDLSANGNRLKFFRDAGTITMDTAGVERVDFNALGGADVVTVNDLSGTDVRSVNVDLAGALGGAAGDSAADRVIVNGTTGNDSISVNGDASAVKASGLAATVAVLHSEVANDSLEINTLAGTDTVDSSGLAAGAIKLLVDGVVVP
jgi:Ca2+-binding RTX toxin-like protein